MVLPNFAGFTPVGITYSGLMSDITFKGTGKAAGVPKIIGNNLKVNYTGTFNGQYGMNVPTMNVEGYYDQFKTSTSSIASLFNFDGFMQGGSILQAVYGLDYGINYLDNSTSNQLYILAPSLTKTDNAKINGDVRHLQIEGSTYKNVTGDIYGTYVKLYSMRNSKSTYGYYADIYDNVNGSWAFYADRGNSYFQNTTINGTLTLYPITPPACSTTHNGSIVRNATSNKPQYCNGIAWNDLY